MKIVLFGTGMSAERFYYQNKEKFDFQYCLDNSDSRIGIFHGLPIYKPNLENVKNHFIVVASLRYIEIKEQLIQYQLKEFVDFNYDHVFGEKKQVILHGNCHNSIIMQYLLQSKEFSDKYGFYPVPMIYLNQKKEIDSAVLKKCDLFIHQDIRSDNGCGYKLSDEYILSQLNKTCKTITIPNLYGLGGGFFPQLLPQNRNNKPILNDQNGMFPFADCKIDSFMQEHIPMEKMISNIKEDALYSLEETRNNFERFAEKIQAREKKWDIKIYSYIMENYKTNQCFYEINHPTNFVLEKISRDILKYLGFDDKGISIIEKGLNEVEVPIYPCVKNQLGLLWEEKYVRVNSTKKLKNGNMDLEEYVKEYIYWCYN